MTFLFLAFTLVLFVLGVLGMLLTQKHLLIILLSLELLLLASNCNFVFFSLLLDDVFGQIYGLLILALAASETAIGLALLVVFYRHRGGISVDLLTLVSTSFRRLFSATFLETLHTPRPTLLS